MTKYHLIIGMAEFRGRMLPVINCSILADSIQTADFIAEQMGVRIYELKEFTETPKYQNFQLN